MTQRLPEGGCWLPDRLRRVVQVADSAGDHSVDNSGRFGERVIRYPNDFLALMNKKDCYINTCLE